MNFRLTFLALALVAAAPRPAVAACDLVGSLPGQAVLYHGSPVGMFDWRNPALNPAPPFSHPKSPDGPAWFAHGWRFSIHAGVRWLVNQPGNTLFLHAYSLKRQVALLICDDHADFRRQTGISPDSGDYVMARRFCATYAKANNYDGYGLRFDAVRGEPEYILCRPSEVLGYTDVREWPVSRFREGGLDYTGAVGRNFANEEWACVLNNADLTDFYCRQPPVRASSGPLPPHRPAAAPAGQH
jgi:hypothetical protein